MTYADEAVKASTLDEAAQAACDELGLAWRDGLPSDGKFHRLDVNGDRRGKADGSILLFRDEVGGLVRNWKTDEQRFFWVCGDYQPISPADKMARQRHQEEAQKAAEDERKNRHRDAARKANKLRMMAGPAHETHPYLQRKGVRIAGDLRQINCEKAAEIIGQFGCGSVDLAGEILICAVRIDGEITSAQIINERGEKAFLLGGQKQGGFWVAGELPGDSSYGGALVICEGVATALSLHEAVGSPVVVAFDCGNLLPVAQTMRRSFPAAEIIIAGDDDWQSKNAGGEPINPGAKAAKGAAVAIAGKWALPDFTSVEQRPDKATDFNDLHALAGLDAVRRCFEAAGEAQPDDAENGEHTETDASDDNGKAGKPGANEDERKSQAARLVALAADAELFHTEDGTGYADIRVNDHRETWPLRSRNFRKFLVHRFYGETGGAPNSEAMANAMAVIDARAQYDGEERKVHLRIAEHAGNVYLDLGDSLWRAVEIDATGWRIVREPPVRFRHPAGMLPLPDPVQGGDIERLRRFLNVKSDADWVLAVAWLLAALSPNGPYPILVLTGEQGTAKTTFCSLLRSLGDPNDTPLRSLSREDRDLFIAATNGHVIAFDNISGLPAWLSDSLCRLATGGGFAVRQLFTDGDEIRFTAKRPIILNGIEDVATRGDLADRAIMLVLEPIAEEARQREQSLWAEFRDQQPQILGALLSAVSHGLKMLPKTELARLPRMADFAIWATACETEFWPAGTFMEAYTANRAEAMNTVLDADPVAAALRSFMETRQSWTGTAAELFTTLTGAVSDAVARSREWPGSPRGLSARLTRLAPALRKAGMQIDRHRDGGKGNAKLITIRHIKQDADEPKGAGAKDKGNFASEQVLRPKDDLNHCSETDNFRTQNESAKNFASDGDAFASETHGDGWRADDLRTQNDGFRTQSDANVKSEKPFKNNKFGRKTCSDAKKTNLSADEDEDVNL